MSTGRSLPPISPTSTVTASQRSSVRPSQRAGGADGPLGGQQASQRSVGKASTSHQSHHSQGSSRSITSSVALGKLAQLEEMLIAERRAREDAENTMLALQRERIAREEAVRRSESSEKQLADILHAVRTVVAAPENPGNIRKLQTLLKGGAAQGGSSGATSSTPPTVTDPTLNSDGRPRNFLDSVGQYERSREKAKREAKQAQLAKQ